MSSEHVKQSLITLISLLVILGVTIIGLLCINSHCRELEYLTYKYYEYYHQHDGGTYILILIAIPGVTNVELHCINSHCRELEYTQDQHHLCDNIINIGVGCQNEGNQGIYYTGSAHRTEYGDTCINWRKHSHHNYLDHNHCRNPMGNSKERVWCYTGSGTTWEYCDVPFCIEPGQESMKSTEVEKQAIPVIITATIILATVSFFLAIVIFLIVANWYCNRGEKKDDTIELVEQSDSGIFSSQSTDIALS